MNGHARSTACPNAGFEGPPESFGPHWLWIQCPAGASSSEETYAYRSYGFARMRRFVTANWADQPPY